MRIGFETGQQTPDPGAHLRLCGSELFHLGRVIQIIAGDVDAGRLGARLGHFAQDGLFVFRRALHNLGKVGNEIGAALELGFDIGPLGLGFLLSRRD